jgi:hypothetical protein
MYHAIVARRLRAAFAAINAGRFDGIVEAFAPEHRHAMTGRHALAGERRSLASTARWYARLHRLLPGLGFDIHAIAVRGFPWRTVALVTWDDHFRLPDGALGTNRGVHEFELRWGRVTSLTVHCDTQRLATYLDRIAAAGIAEATAPPISDVA